MGTGSSSCDGDEGVGGVSESVRRCGGGGGGGVGMGLEAGQHQEWSGETTVGGSSLRLWVR